MIALYIVLFVVWLYLLWVSKRAKLAFFRFFLGSVGLFLFMMLAVRPIATEPLAKAVTASAGVIGDLTGMFKAYYQYTLIFIQNNGQSISMFVDYECSGIIEILAFLALLWFFPLYDVVERIVISFAGILWIFAANIIRLVLICALIYFFGNDMFFFAHVIFGRLIFYGLSVMLYFGVFTRPHILRQKIGKFRYGNAD